MKSILLIEWSQMNEWMKSILLIKWSQMSEWMKSILLIEKFWGLVEMTFGHINASFSLPDWQAVKMTFFAPWYMYTVIFDDPHWTSSQFIANLHWTEESCKRRMDVQWNLSLGTPPSLYFITSIETTPLFSWGKGHFFWVLKPGLNLHSRDTVADHKNLWIV